MGAFQFGMLVEQVATTATSAGTTTLTSTSKQIQYFTGSSTQTVKLPPTTGMVIGQFFEIFNGSTGGALTIQFQDATSFTPQASIPANSWAVVKLVSVGTTNGTWVVENPGSSANSNNSKNFLKNSAFLLWQRGTSTTVANASTAYQADRWYAKNSLGTNGVLTYSQVAGVTNGSKFGAKVQITTAPTAGQTNGTELYQTLENLDSLELYGQTASFSVLVKAFGNVNQIGIQFFYKTTEAKVDTGIGSEVTFTVNTSTFNLGSILGQALGTAQTTSGVVGVRIRITGVSSGNTYDINNGFVVEQAMMNLGSTSGTFMTQGASTQQELALCQRYFEKSYDYTVAPAAITDAGANAGIGNSQNTGIIQCPFKTTKRAVPTMTAYNPVTGAIGTATETAGGSRTVTWVNVGTNLAIDSSIINGTSASFVYSWLHWTAEAEI